MKNDREKKPKKEAGLVRCTELRKVFVTQTGRHGTCGQAGESSPRDAGVTWKARGLYSYVPCIVCMYVCMYIDRCVRIGI